MDILSSDQSHGQSQRSLCVCEGYRGKLQMFWRLFQISFPRLCAVNVTNKLFFALLQVVTTTGKECKFPFRQGGRIHHHCITFLSSRPW